ncbi:MAG: hypothetical protein ISS26_06190 [Candidatus Omnitrophica bacterium]|nr:hypothetical protein [Candidatus Omnitrophota bacterium]
MKNNLDQLQVATAGFIQIYVASYVFFRILLYVFGYLIHGSTAEVNYLVTFVIGMFALHVAYTGLLLLKRKNYARIGSISNMFGLAVISLVIIFLVDSPTPHLLVFSIFLLCASIYFIYFLTRPRVKEFFIQKQI